MKTPLTQDRCKRIMIILMALVVHLNLVNIALAQVTDFVAIPTEGYAPLSVHFTDLSTWSDAYTRHWEFPGGAPATATGSEVDVVYHTPGTYTVTLRILLGGQDVGQEVKTDYITVYPVPVTDWGDAPDPPYPTLTASNGAMHLIDLSFYLGNLIDSEDDGQEHPEALGDDHDGSNDDDGVEITDLIAGATNTVRVKAHGSGGILNAWIDFDNNGDWDGSGEHVVVDEGLADGENSVAIDVPAGAAVGFVFARFRFSRQPGLSYDGVAQDGEVEDYEVEIHESQSLDYGDAPDSREISIYPTYLANDGARHPISPIIFLGDTIDVDLDGQPNMTATGDDDNGIDDEDGVFIPDLVPGIMNTIRVKAHLGGTLNVGYLSAWIDFYANNDWDDAGEHIFDGEALGAGWHDLNVFVPADAVVGETVARFRFGLDQELDYMGLSAQAGEVEDYRPRIVDPDTLDFGDAPDDDTYHYQTLLDGGAHHRISDEIYLGSLIDGESDGQPTETATGDDDNGERDEDGVMPPLEVTPGGPFPFTVITHGSGILRGWCDFNGNNQFDHPDEMFIQTSLGEDEYDFFMLTPEDAVIGRTYVRFRYSHDQTLGPGGPGTQGEVEDYVIWIVSGDSLDYGDAPDDESYLYPTTQENDGARHPISTEIYLGVIPGDREDDGPQGTNADGDDLNSVLDDEDGVIFTDPLVQGQPATIHVTMHGRAVLRVFIDWNADGDWEDFYEQPYTLDNGVGNPTCDFDVNVPGDAAIGPTYARFRYSNDHPPVGDSGQGGPGEVEDYLIEIVPGDSLDFGDAPEGDGFSYMTLLPLGPYHTISDEIYLGAYIDGEPDGQPAFGAIGDDIAGSPDDEDGIVFTTPLLVPGQYATIEVTVHLSEGRVGYLHGWIDFQRNGNWVDPGEYVTDDAAAFTFAASGTYSRDILVPEDAEPGATYARFRFSSDSQLHFASPGSEGEVEDYIVQVGLDFGDAPDDDHFHYRTLLINEGARHPMSDDVYLGTRPDGEIDGWQSIDALGDDHHPPEDDENGVVIPHLVPAFPAVITVTYHNTLGVDTYFHGWIDWNRNGMWEEFEGERLPIVVFPPGTRTTELAINVPPLAIPGPTYARFRLSPDEILPYFTAGSLGEVEDYRVFIDERPWDFGDAPDDGVDPVYPTLFVHDGARHVIDPDVYLGERIDAETDGQPHDDALGDDLADQDDDDGVVFDTELIPGERARITVTASVAGFLDAHADFDGSGDWLGADEEILFDEPLHAGPNSLEFPVPHWATAGKVFFRFRFFSPEGPHIRAVGDHTVGPYINGEVEDYVVEIEGPPGPGPDPGDVPGALKWFQPPLKNRKSFYPNSFWGWDEPSIYTEQIIIDDWFCADPRPVTGIRWWGSYCEWDSVVPPPYAPESYHVAIWTDTDVPWKERRGANQPDSLVWEQVVSRSQLNETVVGSDFFHSFMEKPDTCFQYDLAIPMAEWFHQEGDSTYYWLSISAQYAEESPDQHAWGWKTRDRYFRGDAIRILAPTEPALDSLYRSGETMHRGWDMSFVLFTTEYGQSYDYGDARDPEYPTEFDNNGAHHMLWPGITMGEIVDGEPDGKSDEEALYDDKAGSDDEDGVEFTSDLQAGGIAHVTVNASTRGVLNAWIDYDADGEWGDPGEHIFINMPLFAGNNNLAYNIPLSASATSTYARFRFSTAGGITPKGLDIGGEVEDYEITISPVTAVEEDLIRDQFPKRFELMQNYPNPFNPETTIKFQLPQAGEVLLTIYDIYGREVRTLLHGEWSPGSHAVIWDGRDRSGQIVATGMYFYRIDVRTIMGERRKYVDVKKMIFMK